MTDIEDGYRGRCWIQPDTLPGHLGSGQWGVALLGQRENHGLWVKCATSAECQKLVYQLCSRLRVALGSSLIRDTLDSFMLMV
jgi:hypothetical protein